MNKFNHAICQACWDKKNPNREAYHLVEPEEEVCCYCGNTTLSGIYVRDMETPKHCQHKD